jgi:hypothetical protein
MDLLERYLQAVRFFLPGRQQDDIVRELSENLLSQMEDRAEELGRPLNGDEQADILRRHGHPMLVAGRYRSHQQLIGPVFFPIYLFALKAGLGVALLVTIIVTTITTILADAPVRQIVEAFLAFPGRALMVFAWTTLGFATLDFAQSRLKLPRTWDPRSLPKVVRHADRISRARSQCELVLAVGCVVWVLAVPWAPFLVFGPAAAIFAPAPVWGIVYVPILLLAVAGVVNGVVNFTRPYGTPVRSMLRAATQLGTLAVGVVLLRAHEWVVVRDGATLPGGEANMDRVVDVLNAGVQIGLVILCIVSVVEIVREVRWASSHSSDSAPAPHVNGA